MEMGMKMEMEMVWYGLVFGMGMVWGEVQALGKIFSKKMQGLNMDTG